MTSFDVIRISAFIAVTIVIVFVSRKAILRYRSHGFYRFFAWEAIGALIILNLPYWFTEPFSVNQSCSWFLLIFSLVVLWFGVTALRGTMRTTNRTDRDLYTFEKTSSLVTSGIYGYIRHPLYASLLYLAWGAFLKNISLPSAMLMILSSLFLMATARADERECIEYFGPDYQEYMKVTKRFIPFVF